MKNIKLKAKVIFLLLAIFSSHLADSQLLDLTFNSPLTEDAIATRFPASSKIYVIKEQADGKLLVGGSFEGYNGKNRKNLVRINRDGSLDESFRITSGFSSEVKEILVLPDQKIIVAGNFNRCNGTAVKYIVRLLPDGTLDKTFETNRGVSNTINTVALMPDGKLVVGGEFQYYENIQVANIVRLNQDGTLDASMPFGKGFSGPISSIALQKGKLLVAGNFTYYNDVVKPNLVRLTLNGGIDLKFNIAGDGFKHQDNLIRKIAVLDNNKILVAGSLVNYNQNSIGDLVRLNEDGWIDRKFNNSNKIPLGIETLAIDADGSIYVAGSFRNVNGLVRCGLAKFNPEGVLDNNACTENVFINNNVFAIEPKKEGGVWVGGSFERMCGYRRNHIASLDKNAKIITREFNLFNGFDGNVIKMIPYKSKILVAGLFKSYNDETAFSLVLMNEDGIRDRSVEFDSDKYKTIALYDVVTDNKNNILLAGEFENRVDGQKTYLLRLDPSGKIDESLFTGNLFNNAIRSIKVQSDGKIWVGGEFTEFDGNSVKGIARLHDDGTLDKSFKLPQGLLVKCTQFIFDSQGDFFVIGDIIDRNATATILKLKSNGMIDNTFKPNVSIRKARYIHLLENGNLLLGGEINFSNTQAKIVRLDKTGKYDNTFTIDKTIMNCGDDVSFISPLSDNSIIVGFATILSNAATPATNGLIKLSANGVLQKNFAFRSKTDTYDPSVDKPLIASVYQIPGQNKIIVGGDFSFMDNFIIYKIARLIINPANTSNTTAKSSIDDGNINPNSVFKDSLIILAGVLKGKATKFKDVEFLKSNELTGAKVEKMIFFSDSTGEKAAIVYITFPLNKYIEDGPRISSCNACRGTWGFALFSKENGEWRYRKNYSDIFSFSLVSPTSNDSYLSIQPLSIGKNKTGLVVYCPLENFKQKDLLIQLSAGENESKILLSVANNMEERNIFSSKSAAGNYNIINTQLVNESALKPKGAIKSWVYNTRIKGFVMSR